MTLDEKHWITRLYLYGLHLLEEFSPEHRQTAYRQHTNLCHFMRVILIYIPFVWIVRAATVAYVLFVAIRYPIETFGTSYYVKFWILVALATAIGYVMAWFWKHLKWAETEPREHTAVKLLGEFLKAKKAKICPLVEIGDHSDV